MRNEVAMKKFNTKTSLFFIALCIQICNLVYADDTNDTPSEPQKTQSIELPEDLGARPTIALREPSTNFQSDKYLEAYIQGLIDAKFPKNKVLVTIRNGEAILNNLPNDKDLSDKIVAFVKKFSSIAQAAGYNESIAISDIPMATQVVDTDERKTPGTGIWLPTSTVLFPTMVANPRQISFSVGQRFRDTVGTQRASAVSFGDQLPMYRWCNMWKWHGDLQLELEGGVFALFNHTRPSSPLLNADYYVGIPLSYAVGPYAFRLRLYHISSHLGDELKSVHRHVHRRNKSFEAIDFFSSYFITNQIRVYGGLGIICHSDSEMRLKPFYVQYGAEIRVARHNFTQLYGEPFLAMHFENAETHNWNFDSTFAIGYEWGKIQGFGRKLRAFIEYHEGYSPEGQFYKKRTDYLAFRLAYGF